MSYTKTTRQRKQQKLKKKVYIYKIHKQIRSTKNDMKRDQPNERKKTTANHFRSMKKFLYSK